MAAANTFAAAPPMQAAVGSVSPQPPRAVETATDVTPASAAAAGDPPAAARGAPPAAAGAAGPGTPWEGGRGGGARWERGPDGQARRSSLCGPQPKSPTRHGRGR